MLAPNQMWPLGVGVRATRPRSPNSSGQVLKVGAHLVVIIIQARVLTLQLNHLHLYHPVLLFLGHEVSIGVWLQRPRLLG